MTKTIVTIGVGATLFWAGTALATPTPQQLCDFARITAWKVYATCVDTAVAKDAKGVTFDEFKAFWKCRHAYFKKWTAFQSNASLATSTCHTGGGARFVDNGDGTVTDPLSTLVWEKKTNDASVHDEGNTYTWSTGTNKEDGTAFTSFLGTVNSGGGFGGANGWRLPTLAELQTVVLDFTCTGAGGGPTCSCPSSPCVDAALDAGNTQSSYYWSATGYVPLPSYAWGVNFTFGSVFPNDETFDPFYVRAIRGGL